MVPFSSDNNGPGASPLWGEFHTSTLYCGSISSSYILHYPLRKTEEKYPGISRETYAPLVSRWKFSRKRRKIDVVHPE